MKTLVVYYSRTGKTKKLGETIANKLNADIEEIIDTNDRKGVWGWLSGGRDAFKKMLAKIKPLKKNPDDYDLVIIGSPIWAGTITPAVRTFLNCNSIRQSAFFCTHGGSGGNRAFADMLHIIVGTKCLATLSLSTKEIAQGNETKINEFIGKINSPGKSSQSDSS